MTIQETIKVPEHKSIAAALASAQMEMGKALKSANNPHFRSKYADLSSVTDACMPALNKHGIAVIQPCGQDEHGSFVETVLIHGESGQELRCRVPLIVQKNDMQGYGSAVTYARRYGLMSMAGIAPEDDDGNAAAAAAPKQEQRRADPKPAAPTQEAVTRAVEYLNEASDMPTLQLHWTNLPEATRAVKAVIDAKDAAKSRFDAISQKVAAE